MDSRMNPYGISRAHTYIVRKFSVQSIIYLHSLSVLLEIWLSQHMSKQAHVPVLYFTVPCRTTRLASCCRKTFYFLFAISLWGKPEKMASQQRWLTNRRNNSCRRGKIAGAGTGAGSCAFASGVGSTPTTIAKDHRTASTQDKARTPSLTTTQQRRQQRH